MTGHLALLDRSAPGLVVAVHVVGSATLDDLAPGSDLDLVVELSRTPTETDLAALSAALTPELDVAYLVDGEPGPWARDGELHADPPAQLTPVLRHQLNLYSRTLRGARPHFPVTAAEVADYCRTNLREYWQPLLDHAAAATGPVFRDGVLWLGLGPARLWHTIRTGEIVGKSRAGELAAAHWTDLAGPVREIVAARHDPNAQLAEGHRRAVVELGRRVLAAS
ncbi:nucleotidyltransferase domain-containing protein [Actinosynnema sp. NPDC047251]|uniref:nucleotidyltransferase domain-containing protein n=1 Tax=Saccharothrix espanaensis TaxID=103731 RepID=UPI0003090A6C|nr:nucleotidyltransferase domain-containing protein [Saccharothrix espanaensis]